MFRFAQRDAIQYLEAEAISALDFVTHAFCTRLGGISEGPFTSLNTGFLVGDREEDVRRNLALIGKAFAIPAERLVLMGQVHGDRIFILDGDGPPPGSIPECDGLITDRPGVALGIRTADCVPLLFVDRVRRVIGVAHAGWRGTALRIASKMVDLFEKRFSSRVEDILIAIGPAIGVCCYQVDAPVYAAFSSRPGADEFSPSLPGGRQVDARSRLSQPHRADGAGGARGEYPLGRTLHRLPAGPLLFAPRRVSDVRAGR